MDNQTTDILSLAKEFRFTTSCLSFYIMLLSDYPRNEWVVISNEELLAKVPDSHSTITRNIQKLKNAKLIEVRRIGSLNQGQTREVFIK